VVEGGVEYPGEAILCATRYDAGARVRLAQEWDVYPLGRIAKGATGIVVRVEDDCGWVRMDAPYPFLAEWDNELQIYNDSTEGPGWDHLEENTMPTVTDYEDARLWILKAFHRAIMAIRHHGEGSEQETTARTEAFMVAKAFGWDYENNEDYRNFCLKATGEEILAEAVRLLLGVPLQVDDVAHYEIPFLRHPATYPVVLAAVGFRDWSYGNDGAGRLVLPLPGFVEEDDFENSLQVWVSHVNPEDREDPEPPRFTLIHQYGPEPGHHEVMATTDDIAEVLRLAASKG